MYLKKHIEHWSSQEWNDFFIQFPHLALEEEKEEIKTILR